MTAVPSPRDHRTVRIFFDFGHRWPLWESGTDKYAMEPSDYGFSDKLVEELDTWRNAWLEVADYEAGESEDVPSLASTAALDAARERAVALLQAEKPEDVVYLFED